MHFFLSPSYPNTFKKCGSELPSEGQSVSNSELDSTFEFSDRFTSEMSRSDQALSKSTGNILLGKE